MNEKIFIPINACNEKNLLQTVLSAINNAQYPNRLSFGIFEHSLKNTFADFSNIQQDIVHVKVDYSAPLGVGLPRVNASLLSSSNHDFVLQIDAHMIFEKNWDVDLINYYSLISQKHNNPIISTYVPWWYENENNEIKLSTDESYVVDTNSFSGVESLSIPKLAIDMSEAGLYKKYITVTGQSVDWSDGKQYEEHYGISGHFMFTKFDFIKDIPHDPFIPWGGDEAIIAIRSWTRGYRIFTIPKAIVWHKNKWGPSINGIGVISLDKNDWRIPENSTDKKMFNLYYDNQNLAYKRMKDIFLGKYIGYWGSASKDLLEEYQEKTNSNFANYYEMIKEYLSKNDRHLLRIMYE